MISETELEHRLCRALCEHPTKHRLRWTDEAHQDLLRTLFWSLAGDTPEHFRLLFPREPTEYNWSLTDAQGTPEGGEYTEGARGKRCGHILKANEPSFRCRTCSSDATVTMCVRCFDASDHRDHTYFVTPSSGNSGCCDCGDEEAWTRPLKCAIHTKTSKTESKGKGKAEPVLPNDLIQSIRTTISKALDYFCDVISCSPEQLRRPKLVKEVRQDMARSRLLAEWYGSGDAIEDDAEYSVVLWNDEKHTIREVSTQVSRACRETGKFGEKKANEVNDYGRSIVKQSTDLDSLLTVSNVIEQIKVTVSIRSSRDTYREGMCGAIIEWLHDISSCNVGSDSSILRETICAELLQEWRPGSAASNAAIGKNGIYDHAQEEEAPWASAFNIMRMQAMQQTLDQDDDDEEDEFGDEDEYLVDEDVDDDDLGNDSDLQDIMDIIEDVDEEEDDRIVETLREAVAAADDAAEGDVDMGNASDSLETNEAADAGYPPPPPPPARASRRIAERVSREESMDVERNEAVEGDGGTIPSDTTRTPIKIPKTPMKFRTLKGRCPRFWAAKPPGFLKGNQQVPLEEDITKRTRLDWLMLFDLRLWKKVRCDLRDLYISTVVNIPRFKHIMGLKYAALYTPLAQLYLVADREPDQSILHLSVQILTTPSILEEAIKHGNFFSNLLAVIYTYLTTRQVGYPHEVTSIAALSFDNGTTSNRRLYHFFQDLRYLLPSPYVKRVIKTQEQYLLQFLDFVRLLQGICPNQRAVGDHVQYETDTWISASLLAREMNRVCRLFSEAFQAEPGDDDGGASVQSALRHIAKAVLTNSVGLECGRFTQSEIKRPVEYHTLVPFEFELASGITDNHKIVEFFVEEGYLSFHHPLHYTLSWLMERGKSFSRGRMMEILHGAASEVKQSNPNRRPVKDLSVDDLLLAMFDYPLRVCSWLAQIKCGMWVRNGLSLRHQAGQYRGTALRDIAYYRDVLCLQAALVICDPSQILASIVDRFGLRSWVAGDFSPPEGWEDNHILDVAEEFYHLLIVLASERTNLIPLGDDLSAQDLAARRDIAHALCYKPLSFSELASRLPSDKYQDLEECQDIIDEMTIFRAPEGLNDSGTFELKPEYLELLDPYGTHCTKNQREEAEVIHRKWTAKTTGKPLEEVVFEPKLRPILSGVFQSLTTFMHVPLFAQIVFKALQFANTAKEISPNAPATRIEALLHVVLHLTLLATIEDQHDAVSEWQPPSQSFIINALMIQSKHSDVCEDSIMTMLYELSVQEEYASCSTKIKFILNKFHAKQPELFEKQLADSNIPDDYIDKKKAPVATEEDIAAKRKEAAERQKKIMAAFHTQQAEFMANQNAFDWHDADSDELEDAEVLESSTKKFWKYPAGTCILCQEETDEVSRLSGTFALLTNSSILRQTPLDDAGFLAEALNSPVNLDRSCQDIRPYGVASANIEEVNKFNADGEEIVEKRARLGSGFPTHSERKTGPLSTGCGHLMHFSCFENYCTSTVRRQTQQISRNHPERMAFKEFLCPLCKALGNAFIPIVWKGKEESYPGVLNTVQPYEEGLDVMHVGLNERFQGTNGATLENYVNKGFRTEDLQMLKDYNSEHLIGHLATRLGQFSLDSVSQDTASLPSSGRSFWSIFGGAVSGTPRSRPSSDESAASSAEDGLIAELVAVYKRLQETMVKNTLKGKVIRSDAEDTALESSTLDLCVGYSITVAEIAVRGLECEVGSTLLSKIPPQTLTHLRIISETAFSFVTTAVAIGSRALRLGPDLARKQYHQAYQLFVGLEPFDVAEAAVQPPKLLDPLLSDDIFIALAEYSTCLIPVLDLDIHHIARICYTAEIVKTLVTYGRSMRDETGEVLRVAESFNTEENPASQEELNATARCLEWLREVTSLGGSALELTPFLYRMVRSYALPFLRKTIVLMHVRYGVDFPNTGLADLKDDELDRLTRLLRFPTIAEIFESLSVNTGPSTLKSMVSGWLSHMNARECFAGMRLSHPPLFELIALPTYFDQLMDEANKRRCPTTGREVADPAICLFCGEIFCSQAYCCLKDSMGGCNQHMERCNYPIGLFLNIRKCVILYLHHRNGSYSSAPYLDKHGEVDMGMRRSKPLILNQKRYDKLCRDVWLSGGIPAVISRKLEMETNNGGWESM